MSAIRVISSWEAAYDELDSDDEFMADENDDQPDGISTNAPTHSEIKMCIVSVVVDLQYQLRQITAVCRYARTGLYTRK